MPTAVRAAVCQRLALLLTYAAFASAAWHDALAEQAPQLELLSLQQLSAIEVTSVSRSAETLNAAPAAIYVITREQILRSGVATLPELLRLAPNLLVTQLGASNFSVATRGLGGNPDLQAFSNKLLLLIDGRSVYSPLYSGIYMDAQDVLVEDVDRVEVISGPGATLWGANAVNGVINVITRPSWLSQGRHASVRAGARGQDVALRIGDATDAGDGAWRAYAKGFRRAAEEVSPGVSARDDWYSGQVGFRADQSRDADTFTLQGDLYRGLERSAPGAARGLFLGGNVLGRWQRHLAASDFQLQAYVDQSERFAPEGGNALVQHTYDLESQHGGITGVHQWVWGVGIRSFDYQFRNSAGLQFLPTRRRRWLENVYAQDTWTPRGGPVRLTLGLKMENDPYSGWSPQPDARVAWQLGARQLLWASASRAIRAPTPFDMDVVEKLGDVVYVVGQRDAIPEQLWAYELGYRAQPSPALSLSASVFYNVYDELRSIETASASVVLPLHWGHLMRGHVAGITAWARWQPLERLRVSPGFTLLRREFAFKPGSSGLGGTAQAGNDPPGYGSLSVSADLPRRMTLDATLRYVGALPSPALPHVLEMDARWAWRLNDRLEVSLVGTNLLHRRHLEFPSPNGEYIGRSVMVGASWKR